MRRGKKSNLRSYFDSIELFSFPRLFFSYSFLLADLFIEHKKMSWNENCVARLRNESLKYFNLDSEVLKVL